MSQNSKELIRIVSHIFKPILAWDETQFDHDIINLQMENLEFYCLMQFHEKYRELFSTLCTAEVMLVRNIFTDAKRIVSGYLKKDRQFQATNESKYILSITLNLVETCESVFCNKANLKILYDVLMQYCRTKKELNKTSNNKTVFKNQRDPIDNFTVDDLSKKLKYLSI